MKAYYFHLAPLLNCAIAVLSRDHPQFLISLRRSCLQRMFVRHSRSLWTAAGGYRKTVTLLTLSQSADKKYVADINVTTPVQQIQVTYFRKTTGYLSWIFWFLFDLCNSVLRIIQVTLVFLPVLLLFPVSCLSSRLRTLWYHLLLWGIEFSGPVFIKVGQWASTRRDIFPEELCSHLAMLQRRTRPHSWYYTKKTLERTFGPNWQDVFRKIDNSRQPVGSGCCAQVYKAWVRPDLQTQNGTVKEVPNSSPRNSFLVEGVEMLGFGHILSACDTYVEEESTEGLHPVALKVLHPCMEALLRRDLRILKAIAVTVTWAIPSLRWLSLPECVDDFSQVMKNQVDLCEEARNLEVFAENFQAVQNVKFPQPIWPLTTSYLMVETFENGEDMQYFVHSIEDQLVKKQLAEIGVNTVLKMVFEDNFAHADLHPGNLLVHQESVEQPHSFPFKFLKPSIPPLKLIILDCGIVAKLDRYAKRLLREVFTAVVKGDGNRVAQLFLDNTNHQCSDTDSFKKNISNIVNTALKARVSLGQVQVSTVITSLFSTLIAHHVKLDGSFSSIILAMVVVEGLGKSLDPSIDLVEKAKPFLLHSVLTG